MECNWFFLLFWMIGHYALSACYFRHYLQRDEITFPKVVSERLIVLSSNKCFAFISSSLLIFSDPAKSHRFSFALLSIPLLSTVSVSTSNWKIEWDLELLMLILVCLVTRFFSPRLSKANQSLAFVTTYSVSPST